ncbi:MAG: AbrB/MazE/SpoVT family DNA-binding domain-containing protein [Oscillospiraceae bacterium]|nr:AbrB/MazE/SpoVT family DNA-binding domain-containing protein [Oscillospiraceae bacterium]
MLDIRKKMSIDTGSRISLIYENDRIIIMNSAVHAMEKISLAMEGEAEKAGLSTQEDVIALCREIRAEVEGL